MARVMPVIPTMTVTALTTAPITARCELMQISWIPTPMARAMPVIPTMTVMALTTALITARL